MPLEYLLREFWLFLPVERVYSNSGLIVRPHRAKMSDKLLESLCLPSVPSSADCCDGQCACRVVANSVIIVIFWVFGILLCQLSLTIITYIHSFIN